jgi:bifunctional DNA-binding transcriptional regulator/antitoxin component of YhaV-PrlF toxin-antitoxin module
MQEDKTYELELKTMIDENGEEQVYVDLPDELVEALRLSEGDELEYVVEEETKKITVRKKEASNV